MNEKKYYLNIKTLLFYFLSIIFIYNINLREFSSGDTIPNRYLPVSIIKEFNLDLNEFPMLYKNKANDEYLYIQLINGRYLSSYPIMPAILATPIYFLPIVFGIPINEKTVDALSKFSASVFATLSVLFIYLSLKELVDDKSSLIISSIYAFATSTWSISSQGIWLHGPTQMFFSLMILFFLKSIKNQKYIIYSSIPLSLAVTCRPTHVLVAFIFVIYVFQKHRNLLLKFLIFPVLNVSTLLYQNFYYYGKLSGGIDALQKAGIKTHAVSGTWTANFLSGLFGLLISPNRGILVYSPFIIFSFWGIYRSWKNGGNTIIKYFSIASLSVILLYSFSQAWWGGYTFGYRLLVDILPFLIIFLVFVWSDIFKRRYLKIIFTLLVIFSVFVQMVGAFCYPSSWNGHPVSIDFAPERVWDFKDSQLLRCIKEGPHIPRIVKKYFSNLQV